MRDPMEAAPGDVTGIEDDLRRELLDAHTTGAIREIKAQMSELVSQRQRGKAPGQTPSPVRGRDMLEW